MGEIKYNGRTYSGLIQANGCFVDTSNVLLSATAFVGSYSYTATEDCFVCFYISPRVNDDTFIQIDGENVETWWRSSVITDTASFYVRKGQTISVPNAHASNNSYIWVYGLMQGSPITFLSEYASACYDTNEREVGCWVDGKPLYQKTIKVANVGSVSSSGSTVITINDVPFDMLMVVNANVYDPADNRRYDIPNLSSYSPDRIYGHSYLNKSSNPVVFYYTLFSGGYTYPNLTDLNVTIQYTKTTDTAGSGKLTPTGFETHHYSTNEQIVGTWIDGKPLYERVFTGLSIALNGNDWVFFNDPTYIENVIDFKAFADNSGRLLNCAITEYQRSNTNGIMFSGITGFNRTVNVIVARFTKTTD